MRTSKIFCSQLPVILSEDAVLVKRMTKGFTGGFDERQA